GFPRFPRLRQVIFARRECHRSSPGTQGLVPRTARPPTDFLGTGAGPMAFVVAPRSSSAAPSRQDAYLRPPGSGAKTMARGRFVMLLFGAVRTNENQL